MRLRNHDLHISTYIATRLTDTTIGIPPHNVAMEWSTLEYTGIEWAVRVLHMIHIYVHCTTYCQRQCLDGLQTSMRTNYFVREAPDPASKWTPTSLHCYSYSVSYCLRCFAIALLVRIVVLTVINGSCLTSVWIDILPLLLLFSHTMFEIDLALSPVSDGPTR